MIQSVQSARRIHTNNLAHRIIVAPITSLPSAWHYGRA